MDTKMDIHDLEEIITIPTQKLTTDRGLVFYIKTLKVNGKEGEFTLTFFSDNEAKLAFKRGAS
tara:strand:- start:257 stop:445 length:189 start_codon:yes stop_codon:yes gene_type:complete